MTNKSANSSVATAPDAGAISAKQAATLLQFLQRTQMQGAEMPAYVDLFNTLSGIVGAEQGGASPEGAPQ